MASLLRFGSRQLPRVLVQTRKSVLPTVSRVAYISTSKKNKDSEVISGDSIVPKTERLDEKEENWMSFGVDLFDRDNDEWGFHAIVFTSIFVLTWITVHFAYYPDFGDKEWALREGYLEIARREAAGLPLLDPNYIDPSKVDLPSEEELGPDFDIII